MSDDPLASGQRATTDALNNVWGALEAIHVPSSLDPTKTVILDHLSDLIDEIEREAP